VRQQFRAKREEDEAGQDASRADDEQNETKEEKAAYSPTRKAKECLQHASVAKSENSLMGGEMAFSWKGRGFRPLKILSDGGKRKERRASPRTENAPRPGKGNPHRVPSRKKGTFPVEEGNHRVLSAGKKRKEGNKLN